MKCKGILLLWYYSRVLQSLGYSYSQILEIPAQSLILFLINFHESLAWNIQNFHREIGELSICTATVHRACQLNLASIHHSAPQVHSLFSVLCEVAPCFCSSTRNIFTMKNRDIVPYLASALGCQSEISTFRIKVFRYVRRSSAGMSACRLVF